MRYLALLLILIAAPCFAEVTYEKVVDDEGNSTGYLKKVVSSTTENVDQYSLAELKAKKAEIEALIKKSEELGVAEK